MKTERLDPLDDYLLHGRAGPEIEARLRDDPSAAGELVLSAAMDAHLSHYFRVVEPAMHWPVHRVARRSPVFQIAAAILVGLFVGIPLYLMLSPRIALPSLSSSRRPAPLPMESAPASVVRPPEPERPPDIPAAAWIASVSGTVTRESDAATLVSGAAVYAGDRIRIAANGGAVFRLPDGSTLSLDSGSEARFLGGDRDEIALERGALQANIKARAPDRRFQVRTPQARIAVLGTSFRVEVTAAETQVAVSSGAVEFIAASGSDSTLLTAGQRAATEGRTIRRIQGPRWQWRLQPATNT